MSFIIPLFFLIIPFLNSTKYPLNCQTNVCYCDTDLSSKNCPEGCDGCVLSGNSLVCTGCLTEYWLNPETQLCDMSNTCGIGGYYNQTINQCFTCPKGCHLCHFNETNEVTCSECLDGFFLDESDGKCHNITCDLGFYLNPYDYSCYHCPHKCLDCQYELKNDNIKCGGCKPNFYYSPSEGTCSVVETCDDGFYYNNLTNKCLNCPKYCTSCFLDKNYDVQCNECLKDGWLDQGSCHAKPKCDNYYYFNKESHSCVHCPSNCTTCNIDFETNSLKCSGCWGGVFFNKTAKTCDPKPGCDTNFGYYYNSTDNNCNKCPGNCSVCMPDSDKMDIICYKCPQNMVFDAIFNVCQPKLACSSAHYYNSTENTCRKCPINCTNCDAHVCTDKILCSSCVSEAFLNASNMTCDPVPTCDNNNYYNKNNNTCNDCPSRCSQCHLNINNNKVECSACSSIGWLNNETKFCDVKAICTPGTYFNNTKNTCFFCPPHCTNCHYDADNIEMNNVTCTKCTPDAFYNSSFGICQQRSICNEGTYYNYNENWCYDCPENCSYCHYDENNRANNNVSCLSCLDDAFYNVKNHTCEPIPFCHNGVYYNSSDNFCHKCPQYCKNCSNDGQTCYECEQNAWFNPRKNSCFTRKDCKGNTYYNKTKDICLYCPYYLQL